MALRVNRTSPPAVGVFYLLDFDRCLVDTERLFDMFVEVVTHYTSIPMSELKAADRDMKRRGDSFDTASFVRERLLELGDVIVWEKIVQEFIEKVGETDVLMLGARQLIDRLDSRQLHYGVLTYGNPLWQDIKLRACGLSDLPTYIAPRKEKGLLIQSWLQSGVFLLPKELTGVWTKALVLVDDKAVSFDGFPSLPSRGFWVLDDTQPILPSQQGGVLSNVKRVQNLTDVINTI